MIGIALFAWLIAFLSFGVLYTGHSPGPKTLAIFAMAPASLVTMLIIAIYRRYSGKTNRPVNVSKPSLFFSRERHTLLFAAPHTVRYLSS